MRGQGCVWRSAFTSAAVGLVSMLAACSEPSPIETQEEAFVFLAYDAVTAELRDPSSAQFTDIVWSDKAVCGRVNGKNAYGGYVGPRRFVKTFADYERYFATRAEADRTREEYDRTVGGLEGDRTIEEVDRRLNPGKEGKWGVVAIEPDELSLDFNLLWNLNCAGTPASTVTPRSLPGPASR